MESEHIHIRQSKRRTRNNQWVAGRDGQREPVVSNQVPSKETLQGRGIAQLL